MCVPMFGAGDAISVRRSSLTNELSRQEEPMKFTIRDLFLVTLVVALALGWWLDRSHLASENRQLEMREQLRTTPPVFGHANDPTESDSRDPPLTND